MKKISLWFLGSLCLIMLISYIDYYRYSKIINDFVGSVVTEVSKNYPNVNEEELVKIVKRSNDYEKFLKKTYLEISKYVRLDKIDWIIEGH